MNTSARFGFEIFMQLETSGTLITMVYAIYSKSVENWFLNPSFLRQIDGEGAHVGCETSHVPSPTHYNSLQPRGFWQMFQSPVAGLSRKTLTKIMGSKTIPIFFLRRELWLLLRQASPRFPNFKFVKPRRQTDEAIFLLLGNKLPHNSLYGFWTPQIYLKKKQKNKNPFLMQSKMARDARLIIRDGKKQTYWSWRQIRQWSNSRNSRKIPSRNIQMG